MRTGVLFVQKRKVKSAAFGGFRSTVDRLAVHQLAGPATVCRESTVDYSMARGSTMIQPWWVRFVGSEGEIVTIYIQDLCAVKERTLTEQMRVLVTSWLQHVDNCALCKGKGFICELCARVGLLR